MNMSEKYGIEYTSNVKLCDILYSFSYSMLYRLGMRVDIIDYLTEIREMRALGHSSSDFGGNFWDKLVSSPRCPF